MAKFIKFKLAQHDKDIYINPEHVACIHPYNDTTTIITFNMAEHDSMCVRAVEGTIEEIRIKLENTDKCIDF